MMHATTIVDSPSVENIPAQLTERPQWVCWRLEQRQGKTTKVPYTPGTLRRASSKVRHVIRSVEDALRRVPGV